MVLVSLYSGFESSLDPLTRFWNSFASYFLHLWRRCVWSHCRHGRFLVGFLIVSGNQTAVI